MPPNTKDYREMVDRRFSDLTTLINAQFGTVHVTLDSIKKDTTLTNGRVTRVEDELEEFKDIAYKAIAEGKHIIDTRVTDCPNIQRFEKMEGRMEKLEGKLEDAMFFIRHPKLFVGIIVFFVLASLFSIFENAHFREFINKAPKVLTEQIK